MAYTAPTTVSGATLITKALWETDHFDNWEWISSFERGGNTLANSELPMALGAGVWHLGYEPGADFASVNFDLSGLATRFRRVRVVAANLRTDYANWADAANLTFNNDKALTYYYSWFRSLQSTPTYGQYITTAYGVAMWGTAGATTTANYWGNIVCDIYQPVEADYPYVNWRSWVINTTTNQMSTLRGGGHYYQSGAVNRIDLDPAGGTQFLSGGANEPTTRIDVYAYYGVED